MSYLKACVIAAMAAAVVLSCKGKDTSCVIARVGPSVLTLDNLYKSIPPEYGPFVTRQQMVNHVRQWIDNQVLYQEALRRNLDKEEAVGARLARMKQDLLCAEMISRFSDTAQNTQITEEMIGQYYNDNKAQFVRQKDAVRFMQIIVGDPAAAAEVRAKVTRENFLLCASRFSKVAVPDPRTVPYETMDEIPPPLAAELASIPPGGLSKPVKADLGWHIILVLDKQARGSVRGLEEVREEIVDILSTKTQNAAIEHILAGLRSKMVVEVHLDKVPDAPKGAGSDASGAGESPDSTDFN